MSENLRDCLNAELGHERVQSFEFFEQLFSAGSLAFCAGAEVDPFEILCGWRWLLPVDVLKLLRACLLNTLCALSNHSWWPIAINGTAPGTEYLKFIGRDLCYLINAFSKKLVSLPHCRRALRLIYPEQKLLVLLLKVRQSVAHCLWLVISLVPCLALSFSASSVRLVDAIHPTPVAVVAMSWVTLRQTVHQVTLEAHFREEVQRARINFVVLETVLCLLDIFVKYFLASIFSRLYLWLAQVTVIVRSQSTIGGLLFVWVLEHLMAGSSGWLASLHQATGLLENCLWFHIFSLDKLVLILHNDGGLGRLARWVQVRFRNRSIELRLW